MSVFGLIDQGNTGILTEDELIQWCLSCGCEIDEVSGLFDKLNKGSGGRNKRKPGRPITSDELRKGMEAQGLAFHRPSNEPVYSETAITLHNKATASRATAAKAAKRDGSTEKKLRRIFDTLDVNEDGQASRSEMIKTLRTSPEARQLLGLPKHFRQGSKGHTQFEEVFQRLDKDNSRGITWQEFQRDFGLMKAEVSSASAVPDLALNGAQQALPAPTLKLIVTGESFSGKGRICELLSKNHGLVHVCTGAVFQHNRPTEGKAIGLHRTPSTLVATPRNLELGKKAEELLANGQPVPDDVAVPLVVARLKEQDCIERGWLLDGFPKTSQQAAMLVAAGVLPDKVVVVEVEKESLLQQAMEKRDDADHTEEAVTARHEAFCAEVAEITTHFPGKKIAVRGGLKERAVEAVAEIETALKQGHRLVVLGAPASGKGRLCEIVAKQHGLIHVSSSGVYRQAKQSELGKKAEELLANGQPVPDDVAVPLVVARLKEQDCIERGWLLDGFPKTSQQAAMLVAAGVLPDKVVVVEVEEEFLLQNGKQHRQDAILERHEAFMEKVEGIVDEFPGVPAMVRGGTKEQTEAAAKDVELLL